MEYFSCLGIQKKLKRTDCFYYYEEQNMGACIPCCGIYNELGKCPCDSKCKDYISLKDIYNIIRNYQNGNIK